MSTARILPFTPTTRGPEPPQPAGRLAEALEELRRGNTGAAEQLCMRILAENIHDADALYVFALANVRSGQLELAAKALGRALQLKPNFDKARRTLAGVASQIRQPGKPITGLHAC